MSEESNSIKWEVLLEEKSINESELPEKVKAKIDKFNELFASYEEAEEGSEEEARLEVSIQAQDEGIVNDINAYIAEKAKNQAANSASASNSASAANSNSSDNKPSDNDSSDDDRPSWKWW